MKMSHAWLRELCPHALDAQTVAEKLTAAGLEVEDVTPASPPLDGVVVARIAEARQHPNADRLRVCMVDAGTDELLQIVCGAPNAREGLITALATIGTTLPGDFKIKKGKLRGEVSMGMLCGPSEIGLDGGDGIIELPADLLPGTPLTTALDLDDQVLDIGLTPNRGDCLSALGIAREMQALQMGTLTPPPCTEITSTASSTRVISIADTDDCRSYYGRVIEGLDTQRPTPLWMVERLRRAGLRSRGPLVDVTNYVMLELGQPLHAFDNDKLSGAISVRRAQVGETLTLLNDQQVSLDSADLLICDDKGPQALAGAMGGLATAVGDDTTSVFLESASFTPAAVAGLGRRHKLVSDALHRFERGTDPALPSRALDRATQLLLDICGGFAGPATQAGSLSQAKGQVELDLNRCNAILGSNLSAEQASNVLTALGFTVTTTQATSLQVDAPTWRSDIHIAEDLMEELARIVGYDHLGGSPVRVRADFSAPPDNPSINSRMRRYLQARGWSETVSFSFTSTTLATDLRTDKGAEPIRLANPISDNLTDMRPTLWASMLPIYVHNLRQSNRNLRLFELGRTFSSDQGRIRETEVIAGLAGGSLLPENWSQPRTAADFYEISGLLSDMAQLTDASRQLHFVPASHPALHPGISARIELDGTPIGWAGQLHPALWKQHGEGGKAPFVFECDKAALGTPSKAEIQPIAPYPASRRDLAFIVSTETCADKLITFIKSSSPLPLADLVVFDVFEDESLQEGFKSIAFGLIFQDFSRTLEDGVIDDAVASLIDELKNTFQARLRD